MSANSRILKSEMKDFFYLGYSVETRWGLIKPIKVKDYPFVLNALNVIQMEDYEWQKELRKQGIKERNKEMYYPIAKQIGEDGLLKSIHLNTGGLRKLYVDSFKQFVDGFTEKSLFYILDDEDLNDFVCLIYEINGLKVREKSSNQEIEALLKLTRAYKKAKSGGEITFTAVMSSVAKEFGYKPHDLNDLTLYQLFEDFKRIEKFKNFDTSTLFKTVDAKDKIKIEGWFASDSEEEDDVPRELPEGITPMTPPK